MNGLSSAEASERLAQSGPNALPERPTEPLWKRFLRQFNRPLIFILLFAPAFDFGLWIYEGAHGWPIEATAIGLILVFNAARSLPGTALRGRTREAEGVSGRSVVGVRNGEFVRLPTQDIVPGDWLRLEAGDRVAADGVLRDPHGAMLDESILTGESVPVGKGQAAEAFSGTSLVRGKTLLEVTRTGLAPACAGAARVFCGAIVKTVLESDRQRTS